MFLLAELVALVFYMAISRQMWFYLDEWDFLANRTAFNLGDLFRAHNEHWVTIPVLVYRALWWIFGLRTLPAVPARDRAAAPRAPRCSYAS